MGGDWPGLTRGRFLRGAGAAAALLAAGHLGAAGAQTVPEGVVLAHAGGLLALPTRPVRVAGAGEPDEGWLT